ncbi:glycoside hydrolase family 43 protein [Microbacterium gilvum]|uniref:1,4-beta-xylanase n=1 Tax=Microbacterium gilvum TaxID=1336204 RepID=A0ABP9A0H7_9MICO
MTYDSYLFVHFTGEDRDGAEQVHFAVSRGASLTEWDLVNDGEPVLVSQTGTGGVRDPFLLRRQDGTWVILATDLKVHGIGDFLRAQETGSRDILIWESDDLVAWEGPRAVTVMDERAGNVWAPESLWSEELGVYLVYWASNLYEPGQDRAVAGSYNRMMLSTTTDFRTFTPAEVWIDVRRGDGYGTIDSTLVREGGVYHRFTKDEQPDTMLVFQERSVDPLVRTEGRIGAAWELLAEGIGGDDISHGEGPIVVRALDGRTWLLLVDWPPYGGGTGYRVFEADDLASGAWRLSADQLPPRLRHGSVVPITADERARVTAAWRVRPMGAEAIA